MVGVRIWEDVTEVFRLHNLVMVCCGHSCVVLQGTLYPDVIESCPPPGSGQKHSHTIKSHHNVGGLPKDLQFKLIEPFRELFKDEVRGDTRGAAKEERGRAGEKQLFYLWVDGEMGQGTPLSHFPTMSTSSHASVGRGTGCQWLWLCLLLSVSTQGSGGCLTV